VGAEEPVNAGLEVLEEIDDVGVDRGLVGRFEGLGVGRDLAQGRGQPDEDEDALGPRPSRSCRGPWPFVV